jgi:antitoxin component of MazEF toxin-antitoxin module
MERKIVKVGRRGKRGYIVSMPAEYLRELELAPGDYVSLSLVDGKVIIEKI